MNASMKRRSFLKTSAAAAALASLPPALRAQARPTVFRWIPQADLAILDPTWSTVTISQLHAGLVFDNLYGVDKNFDVHPQMVEGHNIENDGKQWTITLREGLVFHDGTPVLARDAVASIKRYGKRDLIARMLMDTTDELVVLDDRTFRFRLKKPFPLLSSALTPISSNPIILPERLANTAEGTQITEMMGSGPYRFRADQWVSGSRVVYEKFDGYVPRKDAFAPSYSAGPKVAHIDRVQWSIIPDTATAVAALQAGEVDGIEIVDKDFLPILRADPNLQLIPRRVPSLTVMRLNHLQAPFNNPAIRRALLGAINQTEYMTAVNGADFPEYFNDKTGVFMPGTPMANDAGMEVFTSPRNLEKVRAEIKAAGYNGERVVILDPADYPTFHACALVTADVFKRVGLNVDLQAMDWGTMMQRRSSQEPVDKGGWSAAITGLSSAINRDPAGHLAIRGNGKAAWFGWPTSDKLEQLRQDWLDAPDLETQQRIARDLQLQVWHDVPFIPLGAQYPITALRKEWTDFQDLMPIFYTMRRT